jgi:hypothetical protein
MISYSRLKALDHQAVRISNGDVSAGRDGSRRVEKLRAVVRQPSNKFVERIDVKDRIYVTDGGKDFGCRRR